MLFYHLFDFALVRIRSAKYEHHLAAQAHAIFRTDETQPIKQNSPELLRGCLKTKMSGK
jgi:hypothetical protein